MALLLALPALWVGLTYDQGALDAVWDLAKGWTEAERQQLRIDAGKLGHDEESEDFGRIVEAACESERKRGAEVQVVRDLLC